MRLSSQSPFLAALRDADWLNRERVIAWTLVLLVIEALIVAFIAAWQHGLIGHFDRPIASDFVSFYAAGKLALSGAPALAYDHAAHYLAEQQVSAAAVRPTSSSSTPRSSCCPVPRWPSCPIRSPMRHSRR